MQEIGKLPSPDAANEMLLEAERRNPGPWVEHSRYAAQAAQLIASQHPSLDPGSAFVLGLLHDIGRRAGVSDLRHTLDGYTYLKAAGYPAAGRICLTHSFPNKDIREGAGKWDGSPQEYTFAQDYLAGIEYTDYDRLIQLCDALALPTGFCLIEKRLMDVALRHGLNPFTLDKWRAFLELRKIFEQAIGKSIYALLPGVVENTFGTG